MTERVDFDKFTGNYNELLNAQTRFFSSTDEYFAKYKVELVRKKIERPINSILEYGCGIGRNIAYLREAFPNATVMGTDISRESLEMAQQENPDVRFACELDSPSDVGQFDLIFVAGVYHHIPLDQRAEATRTLKQRLRRDGEIYIFEHNPFNPVTRHLVNTCPYDEDAHLLRPSRLKAILQAERLAVDSSGYCLFAPPKYPPLVKLEPRLEWLPLGGQYWVRASHAA
jgi:SAM-dependent methyltransferase